MNHNFFTHLFLNPHLQYAITCGLLASVAAGITGSYVVTKKITSISGSISHSILGGIGIFIFLNYKFSTLMDPIYGAFAFAIISSLFIGYVHIKYKEKEDAAISAIWAIGMGIGILFISFVPTHSADVIHFLFGDILSVTKENIYLLSILNIFILTSVVIFYKKFLLICFDEETAKIQNINTNKLYIFLLILISLSIVIIVKTTGIILLITILTIPSAISQKKSKKLSHMMLYSILYSSIFILIGIILSYQFRLPPGGVISIIAAICYFIFLNKKIIN